MSLINAMERRKLMIKCKIIFFINTLIHEFKTFGLVDFLKRPALFFISLTEYVQLLIISQTVSFSVFIKIREILKNVKTTVSINFPGLSEAIRKLHVWTSLSWPLNNLIIYPPRRDKECQQDDTNLM